MFNMTKSSSNLLIQQVMGEKFLKLKIVKVKKVKLKDYLNLSISQFVG